MDYLKASSRLLKASRLTKTQQVQPYDDVEELLITVRSQCNELSDEIHNLLALRQEETDENTKQMLVASAYFHHETISRLKESSIAFFLNRLSYIENSVWKLGKVSDEDSALLSPAEREYAKMYDMLINDYSSKIGLELKSNERPPKSLFIEVRSVEDRGDIETEYGVLQLKKGTTHFIRSSVAQPLIREGYLKRTE